MRYALEDLDVACDETSVTMRPRHVCWHAQQAAEKALKAALTIERQDAPLIHDLDRLRELLPTGWAAKHDHPQLGALSRWAVTARYPGHVGRRQQDASEPDATAARELAEKLVKSIKADFDRRIVTSSSKPAP